jgi:hypothetical protein
MNVYERLYNNGMRIMVNKEKEPEKKPSKVIPKERMEKLCNKLSKPRIIPKKEEEQQMIKKRKDDTVFNKLYKDAERRIEKKKKIEETKALILLERDTLDSLKVSDTPRRYNPYLYEPFSSRTNDSTTNKNKIYSNQPREKFMSLTTDEYKKLKEIVSGTPVEEVLYSEFKPKITKIGMRKKPVYKLPTQEELMLLLKKKKI